MIYILYGDNDLLIEEQLLKFEGELVFFDNNNSDFPNKFKQYLNPRLFGDNPILVIKEANRLNSFIDELVAQLVDSRLTVIFIDKTKPELLLKKFKDHKIAFKLIECTQKPFKQKRDFIKFVDSLIAEYRLKLPPGTNELLASVFLNQPRLLKQEFRKLSAYSQGVSSHSNSGRPEPNGGALISKEELMGLIHWPAESRVWDLTDALLERNWSKFLFYLRRETSLTKDLYLVIGALKTTILNLLLVKAAVETGKLRSVKLHNFYKFRLSQHSNKFTQPELFSLLKILADLDRRYKKYQLDAQAFLSELVYQLTEAGFSLN